LSRSKLRPQRIADFPKVYRDALAYWSTFRNLGFSSDDIFFGFGTVSGEPDIVHLQLQTQGRAFTVVVGQARSETYTKATKAWRRLCEVVHKSTVEERTANARAHLIGSDTQYLLVFCEGIASKGIVIPELIPPVAASAPN